MNSEEKRKALIDEKYPLSAKYDPDWILENEMGCQCLWLCELLTQKIDLKPGMRVLDMGCGKALTSIFLAKEFGVRVFANDLWISANDNWKRICQSGVEDLVTPIHADAHKLPYAEGFFDASICVNSFQFFGTSDTYLEYYFAPLIKPGGIMAFALPGLYKEIEDEVPEHLQPIDWEHLNYFHSADWWRRKFERSRQFSKIQIDDFAGDGNELMQKWEPIVDRTHANRIDKGRTFTWLRVIAKTKNQS